MKRIMLFFLFLIFTTTLAVAAQPIIHVGILRNVTEATVGAQNVFEVSFSKTDNTGLYNHPIIIKIKDKSLYVDTKKVISDRVALRTEDNRMTVNGRKYRGTLEIINNAPQFFTIVEILPLDEYVYGIIKHEIFPKWPEEAVKAQIVAARTYALKNFAKHAKEGYDVCNTTCCQVYGGLESEDPVSKALVDATTGVILTYQGELISTPYHGFCGGYTEDPRNVWEGVNKVKYLQIKKCNFCKKAPRYSWSAKFERTKIESILTANSLPVGKIKNIKVNDQSSSGRAIEIKVTHKDGKVLLKANKFRLLLGSDVIRSARFKIKKDKDAYIFEGAGWGHGVGLCQEGAKGMAEKGYDYKQILKFYYPGTELSQWAN
ncbi:MAG: SpoIID/LytB domain-containing protein [Elusimicrobia bacterium]|nr:SpoIID/LytB domain-containing protein [Elusimicrobiota bacterium]